MSNCLSTSYLGGARDDIEELSRRTGRYWLPFVYEVLIAMFLLTEPPAQEDVRDDLYVMF